MFDRSTAVRIHFANGGFRHDMWRDSTSESLSIPQKLSARRLGSASSLRDGFAAFACSNPSRPLSRGILSLRERYTFRISLRLRTLRLVAICSRIFESLPRATQVARSDAHTKKPLSGLSHVCVGRDSNPRSPKAFGLQPNAIDHSATDASDIR